MSTYLAIDVGTERLTAGIVDTAGEVLLRDRVATPPRDVWPALHRLVRRVVAARPADADPVLGCGVSCEGPIDREAGLVTPFHMPVWQKFPLRERLTDLTGLVTVVDTSGHGRVLAERWIGAARGVDDVMVLVVSNAVESGIVSGGRLRHGRHGNTGAIGHLVVEPEGLPCVCGGHGCLTPYVSARTLEDETNRPLRRAPASIIERTGVMIGRAVASTAAVFDLRLALLSGFVPSVFGTPLLEAARRELDARSRLSHLRHGQTSAVDLDLTVLGSEAALVGAAGLARDHLAAVAASVATDDVTAGPPPYDRRR